MFHSEHEIAALLNAFEDGSLPRERWTHAAHLTMACAYLTRFPDGEAERRIREGIQRYNRAQGVRPDPEGGYHETLTLFWIHVVSAHLASAAEPTLLSTVNGLLEARGDKRLPLEHWSRERLFSPEARERWVEPDLKPLALNRPRE